MKRKRLTQKQEEFLFEAHRGICWRCGFPIDPVRDAWHIGHGRKNGGLACGGDDSWDNIAPEHKRCNLEHAAKVEAALAAKIKRVRRRHLGPKPEPSRLAKRYWAVKEKYTFDWKTRRWVPKL